MSELLYDDRNDATPKNLKQVVTYIYNLVRIVRFPGWKQTHAGEREVKKALRRTWLKYQLHKDQEFINETYGYYQRVQLAIFVLNPETCQEKGCRLCGK